MGISLRWYGPLHGVLAAVRLCLKTQNGIKTYLVCNYGPAGNMMGGEMYKEGDTCSECPSNTCCGSSCAQYGIQPDYEGLCKVIDEDNFSK
uniref:U39-Nephitoxin-Nsp1a_1 n=1 Tax=Nephila sp. SGP-2016 TaxID=1905176 RepID=A0A4V2H9D5_9ARAC